MIKEWSEATYPPWAHGPGYVISHDIARTVYKKYREGHLKVYNKIRYLLKHYYWKGAIRLYVCLVLNAFGDICEQLNFFSPIGRCLN